MTKEIEGLYIGEDGTVRFMKIDGELKTYYDLLGCDMIEMPSRTIGGLRYTIVCDESGLLKERKPTVFDIRGQPMIVGSVFFCLTDEEYELQSLTKAHCMNLADYLFAGIGPEGARFVMSGADY